MPRRERSRRVYYRRRFLNRPGHHRGAYVIADVTEVFGADGRWVDADLTISDCREVVVLDFAVYLGSTAAERSNALAKARLLRDVVVAFTERLESVLDVEDGTRS